MPRVGSVGSVSRGPSSYPLVIGHGIRGEILTACVRLALLPVPPTQEATPSRLPTLCVGLKSGVCHGGGGGVGDGGGGGDRGGDEFRQQHRGRQEPPPQTAAAGCDNPRRRQCRRRWPPRRDLRGSSRGAHSGSGPLAGSRQPWSAATFLTEWGGGNGLDDGRRGGWWSLERWVEYVCQGRRAGPVRMASSDGEG